MGRVPVSWPVDERARAIEQIYGDRYSGFRRAVAAVVGDYDRAHDVVQDGFARALVRRGDFRSGSLEAWVWRIVLRTAFDLRRKGRGRPLELAFGPELVPRDADPELADAIRALPARRRLFVFLRYYADLSYEQIAELCGVSAGTVAATLAQAHAQLREALEPKGAER